ncbi:amidohydrolase family protein [Parahaliea maris]|uniref:Amidohydrolase family protein n=1 Tax=Parahaliea maris TaxID=2716870 RepID=A0A5C9A3N5_9GAMM|nr:amidohydrolase family protein [Parahaliea maris]TXS95326.1 amidohydrolase family protein [Parahaliea maris]
MNVLVRNAIAIVSPSGSADAPSSSSPSHPPRDLRVTNGVISQLGRDLQPAPGESVIDATDCVIYPGLVNTHHHLAQSILKAIPAGLDKPLGDWLAAVPYRYWPAIDPDIMYSAAIVGLSEQLRSGATTCCDHHYLYHGGGGQAVEEALWQAAEDLGIRLVLCRGGATTSGSHRGMRGNAVQPETLAQFVDGLERTRRRYHQGEDNAMRRLVVAPTSLIHSTTREDLQALAGYARQHALRLHSHLLEVPFDEQQARERENLSAVDYAASCDWLGSDVWFAHLVHANNEAIGRLAATGTGIAHCPTSNCRLGSGIAPVLEMAAAGMPVSLGVDGSASSENASMVQELNLAWLLHRAQGGAAATSADTLLRWASVDAARMVGLPALGEIRVGAPADIVLYALDQPRYWGLHTPEWAPILCGEPVQVRAALVNGRSVVSNGEVTGIDLPQMRARVAEASRRLLERAG